MKSGYIYILSNDAFPGFLKIGRTNRNPLDRAKELSTTGVPAPFVVEHFVFVSDAMAGERLIHNALEMRGQRYSTKREFFEMSVPEAVNLLDELLQVVKIEDGVSVDSSSFKSEQKPNFSLERELSDYIYSSLKIPEYNEEVEQEKALELEQKLKLIGHRGSPTAFKVISNIYERNYPSSLKFKEYYLLYLEFLKLSSYQLGLTSTYGKEKRLEVGREVAEYLSILADKNWLIESDFPLVQTFLIEGDALIYEGYINKVSRKGFLPIKHQETAQNL